MTSVKALVPTGYGLNCDYETDFILKLAGAESHRVHINDVIQAEKNGGGTRLGTYHILVLGGGFSWADDHGAGVVLASKLRFNLGKEIERFIGQGKLIIGICNGFQTLVNLGLLPALDGNDRKRRIAITYNDSGNFIDAWVHLKVNPDTPCIFTRGIDSIDLPVRHGEGKFYAQGDDLDRLMQNNQVVIQYADEKGDPADGHWPQNPNGSLRDIAGICDPTGRVFGLMPHPEGFNHPTNHPNWSWRKEQRIRGGENPLDPEGAGVKIFRNAVDYVSRAIEAGELET